MANGLPLQELLVWQAGSRNVSYGTLVAISSSVLFGFIGSEWNLSNSEVFGNPLLENLIADFAPESAEMYL